jgi:hypothetical protein
MIKMKIFLCSTIYDLKDLRNAVEQALRDDGYIVLASESGTIPVDVHKHSYEICLTAAADCDVMVAIVDGRFGGTMPDGKKSITLTEIETAIEAKKQVLVFVRQSVWDAKEVYKRYMSTGQPFKPSKIVSDERIFELIDTLRRRKTGNWLFQFTTTTDIIRQVRAQISMLRMGRDATEGVQYSEIASEGEGIAVFFNSKHELTVINQTARELPRMIVTIEPMDFTLASTNESVERLLPNQFTMFKAPDILADGKLIQAVVRILDTPREQVAVTITGYRMVGHPLLKSYALGGKLYDYLVDAKRAADDSIAVAKRISDEHAAQTAPPNFEELQYLASTGNCPRCKATGAFNHGEDYYGEPFHVFKCVQCRFRWQLTPNLYHQETTTADGYLCNVKWDTTLERYVVTVLPDPKKKGGIRKATST